LSDINRAFSFGRKALRTPGDFIFRRRARKSLAIPFYGRRALRTSGDFIFGRRARKSLAV
jgi:hypothetical protein